MKVLHVTAGKLFGGIETVLVTLARFREASGSAHHEFALCFEGRLETELRATGAAVHRLGPVRARRGWQVARANWRLLRVIREGSVDVVVMHGAWPHVVCSSAFLAAPTIHWCHGAPQHVHALDRIAEYIRPRLVIVNSKHTEHALGNLFGGIERRLIHNPLCPPRAAARSRAAIRGTLGTTNTAVVVACAARMEERKGHRLLLESLSRLRELSEWELWIVGGAQSEQESEYVDSLRTFAESNQIGNRVRFLGQRSDVEELLSAADIFCQPNIDPDGFGMSYVEALYAGLPVVTTQMGGALEVVDESCGVLIQPNVGVLAAALSRLITDPQERERLGQAGPARARQLCDPTARIAELEQVLRECAKIRGRA